MDKALTAADTGEEFKRQNKAILQVESSPQKLWINMWIKLTQIDGSPVNAGFSLHRPFSRHYILFIFYSIL
jgi:hypothetical protein